MSAVRRLIDRGKGEGTLMAGAAGDSDRVCGDVSSGDSDSPRDSGVPAWPKCLHCGEVVADGEPREAIWSSPAEGRPSEAIRHYECAARAAIGSVGHVLGLCRCYGGSVDDVPSLTRRQNAKAALALWRALKDVNR